MMVSSKCRFSIVTRLAAWWLAVHVNVGSRCHSEVEILGKCGFLVGPSAAVSDYPYCHPSLGRCLASNSDSDSVGYSDGYSDSYSTPVLQYYHHAASTPYCSSLILILYS